jgi:hypothetical protein
MVIDSAVLDLTDKESHVSLSVICGLPIATSAAGSRQRRLLLWFSFGPVRALHTLVPSLAVERVYNAVRNEPAPASVHVPVSSLGLLICVKPLRNDQVQVVLRPRHRHV